jgi:hypothetical protein
MGRSESLGTFLKGDLLIDFRARLDIHFPLVAVRLTASLLQPRFTV